MFSEWLIFAPPPLADTLPKLNQGPPASLGVNDCKISEAGELGVKVSAKGNAKVIFDLALLNKKEPKVRFGAVSCARVKNCTCFLFLLSFLYCDFFFKNRALNSDLRQTFRSTIHPPDHNVPFSWREANIP